MRTSDIATMERLATRVQNVISAYRLLNKRDIANHLARKLARLDQIIATYKEELGELGQDDYAYLDG